LSTRCEQRDGAHHGRIGDAGELHLQGNRDVALDFVGRLPGILRDDVDQRRHRIGIGLDVELGVAGIAERQHHQEQQADQHALAQG
jgi:hypothetical protein